jgi:hypothetical protein
MTEPVEPQEPPEPDAPVETPETPQEPTEAPDAPDTPGEREETPEEPEDALSSGQPQAKSEKDIEEGLKKLATSATTWRNRVFTIMGGDAQALIPCELCEPIIPGFRWPQVPDERRAAVMLAIGFEPAPDLEPDKHAHACPDCHGHGKVATGSKVQGQDALPCLTCGGNGWMGERRQMTTRPAVAPVAPAPSNGPQPEAPLDPDREAARAAAQAAGFMVIDTQVSAAT